MAKKVNTKKVTDVETPASDIVDIDLSVTRKKKFRINQDDDRILELDTSDLSIMARLSDSYPKLDELGEKASGLGALTDDDDDFKAASDLLKEIDKEMRDLLDFMFDSNVSEICAPSGSMYDPFEGELRYEHIINALSPLYESNLTSEIRKVRENVKKHTTKYTGK